MYENYYIYAIKYDIILFLLLSSTQIARIIKSITAREIFSQAPSIKRALWGGSFWASSFYINHGNEKIMLNMVRIKD
ncbi:MAG: transposase [Flavobacteriaceae bacterium]|nr:transposase [Flavobacteriaceae bacterium]